MKAIQAIFCSILIRLLPGRVGTRLLRLPFQKIAWIVHPRNYQDLEKEIFLLKRLPVFLRNIIIMSIPPYKVSMFSEGGQPKGYIIATLLLPTHFSNNKIVSRNRVRQAFSLAKKLGAEKISIGGMLSSVVTKSGLEERFGVEVFDGTELLATIAAGKISKLIKDQGSIIKSVGIIGATTKAGSKLSKMLINETLEEIHLFAKTRQNVHRLAEECRKITQVNIFEHVDFSAIGNCDLNVLTAFIPDDNTDVSMKLKHESTFFSIIEPVSPFVFEIEKLRPDVNLIRGINIKAPNLSYDKFDSFIKSGNAFACLTEALVPDGGQNNDDSSPENTETFLRQNNFQIS